MALDTELEPTLPPALPRAAQYVRMSTEHQNYSTLNQEAEISFYANARGIEIVRTYTDEGRSGLTLKGRPALCQLIQDVVAGVADYEQILVYDVSRWGRFQDADESAYYEFLCRQAGIAVHYCAEQFENDGSLGGTLLKSIKRAMAGEFSRELSVKVLAGHRRLSALGYWQGGTPGIGLRRWLLDERGEPKTMLRAKDRKNLQNERVVLRPGPEAEIVTVNRIYRLFAKNGLSVPEIAGVLNKEGILNGGGRPWSRITVRDVLKNEKYIGNNIYGKVSKRLRKKQTANLVGTWIRADGVFEPVVPLPLFEEAQRVFRLRARFQDDDFILSLLAKLYGRAGYLSISLVDDAKLMPSASVYQNRFGTMSEAYRRVGYVKPDHYRALYSRRAARAAHPAVVTRVVAALRAAAGFAADAALDQITLGGALTLSIGVVGRSFSPSGRPWWVINLHPRSTADFALIVRLGADNATASDYLLLPRVDMAGKTQVRVVQGGLAFDKYRFDTIASLVAEIKSNLDSPRARISSVAFHRGEGQAAS